MLTMNEQTSKEITIVLTNSQKKNPKPNYFLMWKKLYFFLHFVYCLISKIEV